MRKRKGLKMDVNFLASIVKVSGDRGRYAEMGIKDGKEEGSRVSFQKNLVFRKLQCNKLTIFIRIIHTS